MEVKINREIREYTEGIFFGLTLRQCACAGLACAAAVLVFLLVKPRLGLETASWVCMLAAFPFVMVGFVKYNGMTAEKFAAAFIRSEILIPKRLTFRNTNYYYRFLQKTLEEFEKSSGSEKGEDDENINLA